MIAVEQKPGAIAGLLRHLSSTGGGPPPSPVEWHDAWRDKPPEGRWVEAYTTQLTICQARRIKINGTPRWQRYKPRERVVGVLYWRELGNPPPGHKWGSEAQTLDFLGDGSDYV